MAVPQVKFSPADFITITSPHFKNDKFYKKKLVKTFCFGHFKGGENGESSNGGCAKQGQSCANKSCCANSVCFNMNKQCGPYLDG